MYNKTRDKKIAGQRNTPYLDKPKKTLLELKDDGKGKAKCTTCGKTYDIYGKATNTNLLGYFMINNCSDIYKMKACKGGK